MKTSLAKTFHETAAAAHDAFPKELKTLVLLLLPASDTPVYVSPEVADQLTKSTAAVKGESGQAPAAWCCGTGQPGFRFCRNAGQSDFVSGCGTLSARRLLSPVYKRDACYLQSGS